MPISLTEKYKQSNAKSVKWSNLENMLQWIGNLFPLPNKMFVPFPHHEIQILVCLPAHKTVMCNSFLVLCLCAPAVAVKRFEKGETSSVEA